MSKELPYFKFYINEWNIGDISLENYKIQGIFINICIYYWSKDCNLTILNLKKKFKGYEPQINHLINTGILKTEYEFISIHFLNEQFKSKEIQSITNKINGTKGGRPNQNKTELVSEIKPIRLEVANQNKTNIEYRKGDNKILNNIEDRKLKFSNSLLPFLNTYGQELITNFSDYWTEPNKSKTKFRAELEKTWDVSLRLKKWSLNNFNKKNNGNTQNGSALRSPGIKPTQTEYTKL